MLLKSVRLRNIRSYTDASVHFKGGKTLLAGDIGSGKSSILLAIEFALFGIVRGQIEGSSLLRHGTARGEVELSFSLEGKTIIVSRSLKRVKDEVRQDAGFIEIDGSRMVGTAIEIKSKVLELLGYPKEALTKNKTLLYRFTVFTPQEEMRHILEEDAEMRKETIRSLFGVDRYRRAQDNSRLVARALREKKRFCELQAQGLDAATADAELTQAKSEELAAQEKEQKDLLQKIIEKLASLKKERQQLEAHRASAQEATSKLASAQGVIREKRLSLERLASEHKELMQSLEALKKEAQTTLEEPQAPPELEILLAAAQAKEHELATKNSVARQKIELIERQRRELASEITALERSASSLKEKQLREAQACKELEIFDNVQNDAKQIEQLCQQLQKQIGENDAAIARAKESQSKLVGSATCPVCRQPLTEMHRHELAQQTEREQKDAQASLASAAKKLSVAQHEMQETRKKLDQLTSLRGMLAGLRSELKTLQSISEQVTRKQKRQESLEAERASAAHDAASLDPQAATAEVRRFTELKKAVDAYKILMLKKDAAQIRMADVKGRLDENAAQKAQLAKELVPLEDLAHSIKAAQEELQLLEKRFAEAQKAIESASEEEKQSFATLSGLAAEQAALKDKIRLLEENLAAKRQHANEAQQLGAILTWLETVCSPTFSVMEQQVLGRVHHEFNAMFRQWFAMLMEDETIGCRLDANFAPVIEQNGYETPIAALSGGERTSVALAFRLALNRVINDFVTTIKTRDMLILDEPTEGFSSEQLDRVRHVLSELGLEQIIIVSHEQKVESFVDTIIRISKRQHESATV